MKDFGFGFADVLRINGIPYRDRVSFDTDCPFCGKKRKLNINLKKSVAKCWGCEWFGGMLKFHADLNGLNNNSDSLRDINKKLNINDFKAEIKKRPAVQYEEDVYLSLDELDQKYRVMLSLLSLSDEHRESLKKRGLSDEDIERFGYKSIPCSVKERYNLAKKMIEKGFALKNLPGFYKGNNNEYTLKDFGSGILIPSKTLDNKIQGFQIRRDKIKTWVKDGKVHSSAKYICLSSPGEKNGGKMRAKTHCTGDYKYGILDLSERTTLKFTEGLLKADVYYSLTKEPILGIQGVENLKALRETLIQIMVMYPNITTIENCLDMDYLTNPNVQRAVEKAKEMIESLGLTYKRITWNSNYKGIDDFALAIRNAKKAGK